jgi:hypothetical protein
VKKTVDNVIDNVSQLLMIVPVCRSTAREEGLHQCLINEEPSFIKMASFLGPTKDH